jgi:predicted DNA-binding ribbon-helix-helix protein
MTSAVRKRSVVVAGHRTSISLEEVFWIELKAIAQARGLSLNALVGQVDRGRDGNLSSALRVFVVDDLKNRVASATAPPPSTPTADARASAHPPPSSDEA